jgi:hypothetical protein
MVTSEMAVIRLDTTKPLRRPDTETPLLPLAISPVRKIKQVERELMALELQFRACENALSQQEDVGV